MLRRLIKIIFYLSTAILSLAVASILSLVIIIGMKTKDGPMDLAFAKPYLEQMIRDHDSTLSFDAIQLAWPGLDEPITIQAKNVNIELSNLSDGALEKSIAIQEFDFVYPVVKLFRTNWMPTHLTIRGVNYHHIIRDDDTSPHGLAELTPDLHLKKLDPFLDRISQIESLRIKDVNLTLERSSKIFQFDVEGTFSRLGNSRLENSRQGSGEKQRGHQGTFSLVQKGGDLTVLVTADKELNQPKFDLTVDVKGLQSTLVYQILGLQKTQVLEFKNGGLKGNYIYDLSKKSHEGELDLFCDQLKIIQKSLWKKPLNIPNVHATMIVKNRDMRVEAQNLNIGTMLVDVSGTGRFTKTYDELSTSFLAKTQTLTFSKVPDLWPIGVAEGARDWIISNMKVGDVTKATCALKLNFGFDGKKPFVEFGSVGGEIHLENTELSYLATMPDVKNIKAIATYDHDHFDIKVIHGESNGLKISEGSVVIGRFSNPISTLELSVNVDGPVANALEIVNQKPLEYGTLVGIQPTQVEGRVTGTLKLSFPLLSPFDPAQIEPHFSGQLKQAKIKGYKSIPLDFQNGELSLVIDPQGLLIEGVGTLSDLATDIKVSRHFEKKQTILRLNTLISDGFLSHLSPGLGQLIQGQAPVVVTFKDEPGSNGNLYIKSDLSKTYLNTLFMTKEKEVESSLEFSAVFDGENLYPQGPVHYRDQNNWVIDVTLPKDIFERQFKSEKPFTFKIHQDQEFYLQGDFLSSATKSILNLKGQTFDLRPLMKTDFSVLSSDDISSTDYQMDIAINVDELLMSDDPGIHDLSLKMAFKGDRLTQLNGTGFTKNKGGHLGRITAEVNETQKSGRKFRLQSQQAGAFFKAVNIFKNIRDGQLEMVAFHDPKFRADEWIGKLRVRSFALTETPFVARLLSMIPTGTTALTSDKGIFMDILKGRFALSPSRFDIHGIRAHGISTGFSLSGYIERLGDKAIRLAGTIDPMRPLNKFISSIPLIGQVITGGKNEGFLSVSFGVGGTIDQPKVSSNPASVLSLGVLKQIFSSQDQSFLKNDKWLNNPDHENDEFDYEFMMQ